MTKFGWTMLTLIFIIVVAVVFFVWTGITEHQTPNNDTPPPLNENSKDTPVVPVSDGAAHDANIPIAADAARSALAVKLGISPDDVLITSSLPTDWPDSCLGLPKEGELCAQAIISGYKVVMQQNDIEYVYRTNVDGTIVRSEEK